MKYCTNCAETLDLSDSLRAVCLNCHQDYYYNPKAAVGILIYSGFYVYLARRKFEPFKGSLDMIGGFLDDGETFEEALSRELMEEVGLPLDKLENYRYLASCFDNYPWKNLSVSVTSAVFMAEIAPGEILEASDDVDEVVKYDLRQLKPEDFNPEVSLYDLLVKLKNTLS